MMLRHPTRSALEIAGAPGNVCRSGVARGNWERWKDGKTAVLAEDAPAVVGSDTRTANCRSGPSPPISSSTRDLS